ncbi:hypothetical protein SUGI_0593650 [Cryptomeria japonica]|nr:hypothetical protein SUGI_0593650 [Cryptomeria japonica]
MKTLAWKRTSPNFLTKSENLAFLLCEVALVSSFNAPQNCGEDDWEQCYPGDRGNHGLKWKISRGDGNAS